MSIHYWKIEQTRPLLFAFVRTRAVLSSLNTLMQIIIMVLLHFQKLIKKLILLWVKNFLAVCIIFVVNNI